MMHSRTRARQERKSNVYFCEPLAWFVLGKSQFSVCCNQIYSVPSRQLNCDHDDVTQIFKVSTEHANNCNYLMGFIIIDQIVICEKASCLKCICQVPIKSYPQNC